MKKIVWAENTLCVVLLNEMITKYNIVYKKPVYGDTVLFPWSGYIWSGKYIGNNFRSCRGGSGACDWKDRGICPGHTMIAGKNPYSRAGTEFCLIYPNYAPFNQYRALIPVSKKQLQQIIMWEKL